MMPDADCTRVLVLSASYGAGHNQAARSVQKAILAKAPSSEVRVVDFFQFVSEPLNRFLQNLYIQSVRHAPLGYGMFYKTTSGIAADSWIQRWLNSLGHKRLLDYLAAFQPDIIICTFPTPAGVLSVMLANGTVDIPVFVVITDFTVHSQWLHPNVDAFFVATNEVAEGLKNRGIDQANIKVSGIPIDSVFSRPLDKYEARETLGLKPDLPVVLVMAGAFAMLGGVSDVVQILANLEVPHQAVVITGRDERLAERLRGAVGSARHPIVVKGFVDDIHTMMSAADLLVTKAGGITVSESLACGLPLIIYRPIPGQEESNTAFLTRRNAALLARNHDELESSITRLLKDKTILAEMSESAQRLAQPTAASVIADTVLESRDWRQVDSQLSREKVLV
jgi:processive 1,2-diacylglycerol beta-glucosyltransferase